MCRLRQIASSTTQQCPQLLYAHDEGQTRDARLREVFSATMIENVAASDSDLQLGESFIKKDLDSSL